MKNNTTELTHPLYDNIDSLCYLGDTLGTRVGADVAVTASVWCAWKKFRELALFLTSKAPTMRMKGRINIACIRSCLLYGCETWTMWAELESRRKRTDEDDQVDVWCFSEGRQCSTEV